jgi:hypothetical protein
MTSATLLKTAIAAFLSIALAGAGDTDWVSRALAAPTC